MLKHTVLCLLIEALKQKPAPFVVLDSHAGAGLYDLRSAEAQKTGEYKDGILRLLQHDRPGAVFAPYLQLVRRYNPGVDKSLEKLNFYPGSPEIARRLMRGNDRLIAVELHPADAKALKRRFGRDRKAEVREEDGYLALKSMLPPKERRGIVLIDPPFEERDEFGRLFSGIKASMRRWAGGVYAIWYPIKTREPVDGFLQDLVAAGIRRLLLVELLIQPDYLPDRLNGCGMVLINPPWQIDQKLREVVAALESVFGPEGKTAGRVEWLVGE